MFYEFYWYYYNMAVYLVSVRSWLRGLLGKRTKPEYGQNRNTDKTGIRTIYISFQRPKERRWPPPVMPKKHNNKPPSKDKTHKKHKKTRGKNKQNNNKQNTHI